MARRDKGHYAAKHPAGTEVDEKIARAIQSRLTSGQLTCAAAADIARELEVTMEAVGTCADLLEIKIIRCDLGLLGYQRLNRNTGEHTLPKVTEEMKASIAQLASNGRLSCRQAWEIADRLGTARVEVARACDILEIKLSPCQLGAF